MQRHTDLGRRIFAARKAKGWKQKELAAAVHVEPITVSRWENGRNMPDMGKIVEIAGALGVSARDLLHDAEELSQPEITELRAEVAALRLAVERQTKAIDSLLAGLDQPRQETPQ